MPDTSKLEKLNRELEKSEKKLRKAINDEKALQHQLKQLTRKEQCRSSRQNVGFRSHGLFQIIQGTLRRLRSASVGACRANVHWTFCTPALAAASYPFVDLPSGDTLLCKLFPDAKFHKICYLFNRQ